MEDLTEVVLKAQRGDVRAFAEIVRRFRNMAFGYAFSRLRDFHKAEDIAQEAFIEAFYGLKSLRAPAAFAPWFRRVVHKHCDRVWRRPGLDCEPYDDSENYRGVSGSGPKEDHEEVVQAFNALPERYRTVISLYYTESRSQADVAAYLNVPLTTVKKRLHDAKSLLKEALMARLAGTLCAHALDERFSKKVIAELRARPNLVSAEGHPLRAIRSAIIKALPDYELIEAREVINTKDVTNPWSMQFAYQPDSSHTLCTDLLDITFREMRLRRSSMRVMTFGRLFHHKAVHVRSMPITHSFSALCIAADADREKMETTIKRILESAGVYVDVKYEDWVFKWFEPCLRGLVKTGRSWRPVIGCGLLSPATLRDAGHDPGHIRGFAIEFTMKEIALLGDKKLRVESL